jgi:hypothetical protein
VYLCEFLPDDDAHLTGFVTKHTTSGELKFFQNLAKSTLIPEDIRQAFFPQVESIVDQLLNSTFRHFCGCLGYYSNSRRDCYVGRFNVRIFEALCDGCESMLIIILYFSINFF